jgi:hypothetical protein
MLFPTRSPLMVGKAQLCTLSEKDVENKSLVNRIQNKSSLVFLSLMEIFQMQSDLRHANITRKRQRNKQASEDSVGIDISQTAHLSLGTYPMTISNRRCLHLSNGYQSS